MYPLQEPPHNAPQALTVDDVATRLHISRSGVYALVKQGVIGHYKVGRKLRFSEDDVRRYIHQAKAGPRQPDPEHLPRPLDERHPDLPSPRQEAGFIICGQDLILDILSNFLRLHGVMALRAYIGSYDSLVSLYQDRVSVATTHLWDGITDDYNLPHVRYLLPGVGCVIINVTYRTQGLYVAHGNPKNIQSWHDFGRSDITMINREKGAGSRVLLDEHLRLMGLPGEQIAGYANENQSHLAVASAVGRGDADVAVGSEKIARQVDNVDFVPLKQERYDLVIRKSRMDTPAVQTLLRILRSEQFRNEFRNIGGYDIRDMGRIMAET